MEINEVALRDAVIEYLEKVDQTQNYIHLRIGSDGLAYVSEDTSYTISAEPGPVTIKHQRGNGQCNLEPGWHGEDDGIEEVQGLIDAIMEDLDRRG